jgi:hypothetical protein
VLGLQLRMLGLQLRPQHPLTLMRGLVCLDLPPEGVRFDLQGPLACQRAVRRACMVSARCLRSPRLWHSSLSPRSGVMSRAPRSPAIR